MIYLDNNATTAVDPEVYDAVMASLKRDTGNPSSSHAAGRKVHEAIGRSRQKVASLLGCNSEEIFFTSGGTESNNLALIGTAMAHGKGHIITSSIEHPSVSKTCGYLQTRGFEVTYVPVNSEGRVSIEDIERSMRKDTFLISVMHSNNETGVLQPTEGIGALSRRLGITFHTDAAQSVGKMNFNVRELSADLVTVVSHKFYGPKGIGALYIRNGCNIRPLLFGAGHEKGLRPGTENVPGIAGLGKACEIAERDMERRISHTVHLRDMLLSCLRSSVNDISVNGGLTLKLPNTLNVRIPGILGHQLVDMIGDQIAASTGSACHAGIQTPSAVLKNMGLSDSEALSSLRLSVGKDNTEGEIKKAAEIIVAAVRKLRENPGGQQS